MSLKHGPTPQGEIVTSHWRVGNARDGKYKGLWQCIVCNDGVWRERKSILLHVGTEKHRKAVKYHTSSRSRGQHSANGRKKQTSSRGSPTRPSSPSTSTNSGQTNASLGGRRVLGSLTNIDRTPKTTTPSIKRLCDLYLHNREKEWFPWPDKITCLLDVMRHLPGATLFDNQNSTLTWGLKMVSTSDIPSDAHMKLVSALLQQLYGVDTFNNQGTYGNNYYVNNLMQIIAQEVANPRVRPHLEFYPEDISGSFANANQSYRWLRDMDAEFTTPMVRQNKQDFYLFEPCLLFDGTLCVPVRWFKRSETLYGFACRLQSVHSATGTAWIVSVDDQFEIRTDALDISFPVLLESYEQRGIADPRAITGIRECGSNEIKPWHHTEPRVGNRWRAKACGHRVLAFPIWLYCETSGALTNGLTYHSFLFAPAGMPQEQTNNQYNIHFLCTSATAHPLEMLEGIFSQIQEGQENGVWAWDCFHNEVVLLVPSIFALLGDSSLQSRFSSLIHPKDRLYCRMCISSEPIRRYKERNEDHLESKSDELMVSSHGSTVVEDVEECCRQTKQFFTIGEPRTKHDTVERSMEAFTIAMTTGKKALLEEIETRYGIRDEYQHNFLSAMPSLVSTLQHLNSESAESYLAGLRGKVVNPVWKSRGLDPHRHSPIEPVQVIISSLVNGFWRNTVTLLSSSDKKTLLVRLLSFDTSGLDYDHISGGRVLQHPSSLTTADYKAIIQAVPFVLYDLVDLRLYDAWVSLCFLVRLAWQPIISDLEEYLEYLEIIINNFIASTIRWSPIWATKAEFHMILHLPQHIHDFGPVTLLSAEKLDFYDDLIQKFNINYRGEAPSKDIARAFAYAHRIRHLLSGGKFFVKEDQNLQTTDQISSAPEKERAPHIDTLISCGRAVNDLLEQDDKLRKVYGFSQKSRGAKGGNSTNSATKNLNPTLWDQTISSQVLSSTTSLKMRLLQKKIAKCSSFNLSSGDKCSLNEWVMLASGGNIFQVGKVSEILQTAGSDADPSGNLIAVLILKFEILHEQFRPYRMSRLVNTGIYDLMDSKKLLRVINVQHNCRGNNCRTNLDGNSFDMEQGNMRINGIVHVNPDDVVFNCVQSCDFRIMQYFSCDMRRADFELAIREGYEYELTKEHDMCYEAADIVPNQDTMHMRISTSAAEEADNDEVYCNSGDEISDGSISITSD